ncbi:MAG: GNAT family N-acetyltransferase [Chloroflexota bacterium]
MKITQATVNDVDAIAVLFDKYRQFYEQEPNLAGCTAYIKARLENNESTIFIARLDSGETVGFTQLYDSFCSVNMTPIVYLYDLFVDEAQRRHGVGRALMARAEQYARDNNASRLSLETGIDNSKAQALYESIGYVRNTAFYGYDFRI